MRGAYFWLAHEDAVLRHYLSSPCPWDEVMPSIPGRTEFGARKRLQRLREEAGTVWTIHAGPMLRELMKGRQRDAYGRVT